MKSLSQKSKVNRAILCGFVASIIINLSFFLREDARPIGRLQSLICMYFPYLLSMLMIGIGILIKSILRGKIPSNEWDFENAKTILMQADHMFKKLLARIYMLIYYPIFFIGGWAGGSALFYLVARIIAKQ